MKLSVVIPAYNEEGSITETVDRIFSTLKKENIDHEIFVVNDNSTDSTLKVLEEISKKIPTLKHETNSGPNGFGMAVRYGLEKFSGDCVAIMMADGSDSPDDLVKFYRKMQNENYDCVFGSRFIKGGSATDYPKGKKIVNRIANFTIRILMGIKYNDCTNAFKLYRRNAIEGSKPFTAAHFNFTIELPLKSIIRGYSYTVLPNSWTNRKHGESKLKLRQMSGRYFSVLMKCFKEKYFSKGEYKKKPEPQPRF